MKTKENKEPESKPVRIEGYRNQLDALHGGMVIIVTKQEYRQYLQDPSIRTWLICTQYGEECQIQCNNFG